MESKPLKESELRKFATCGQCGRKIGETGRPIFWLVTLERHCLRADTIKRKAGLEMMIGTGLANVMGPDEDMTHPVGDKGTIMVCDECAYEAKTCLGDLAEQIAENTKRPA